MKQYVVENGQLEKGDGEKQLGSVTIYLKASFSCSPWMFHGGWASPQMQKDANPHLRHESRRWM